MKDIIRKKLDEIAAAELTEDFSTLTAGELDAFEAERGIRIPAEYREFLTEQCAFYVADDFGYPMREVSEMTSDDGNEKLEYFYNREFVSGSDAFARVWGENVLPIGENMGGDYVCIGIRGDHYGKIYFLYHEDEERADGLYLIADSFEEFILSFTDIGW